MRKFEALVLLLFFINSFGQKKNNEFSFYENKGQIIDQNGKANPDVKYLLNSPGLNVQIKENGFSYDVYEVEIKEIRKNKTKENILDQIKRSSYKEVKNKYHRIDINFVDSNKNVKIIAEGKSDDYENYYNVPGKKEGVSFVHRYRKVTYKNLYNNIDLVFFKPEDSTKPVEYNFLVHPDGKISDIKMRFTGAKTKLKDGILSMNLRFGEMHENIPNSWIEDDKNQNLAVKYRDAGNQTFGFDCSINYSSKTIVIDPVPTRIWATYYWGNSYYEKVKNIRTDNYDNVYISTQISVPQTPNLTTTGAFQTTIGNTSDEYSLLSKFNSSGQRLWSTFIGNFSFYSNGGFMNSINDFRIDKSNNIIVVGKAVEQKNGYSNNITTPGAHKEFATGYGVEGLIMKFNEQGQRLWGTYFGGDDFDEILSLSLDSNDDLIISGRTYSNSGIATSNAYSSYFKYNYWIGFFAKFSSNGVHLYGSYLPEIIYKNAVDNSDNYIFSAYSYDPSFPNQATPGTHQQTIKGSANSLILKFDKNFNKLWGTYYGGILLYPQIGQNVKNNFIYGLGTDLFGNIYIAGNTTASQNIATPGSHKPNFGGTDSDVFLAKLDPSGKRIWGTYYGANTNVEDLVYDMFVNKDGNIFITGGSKNDTGIVTPNGYISDYNGSYTYRSGYVSKFNSAGNQIWGTYYPESYSIFNSNNFVYTYGIGIPNFGTLGTFMGTNPYWGFYLISKFKDCQSNLQVSSPSSVCPGSNISLSASGGTNYSWTGPNGFSSTDQNPIIPKATTAHSGTYSCLITGSGDCDGTFTTNVFVGDITKPVPDNLNLTKITGDCKTVITTAPTATDNCKGQIFGTTTDPLSYSLPGNYTITWKYDDGNGNIATQTQQIEITAQPLPTWNSSQVFCKIYKPKISDITVTATNPKWYDASGNMITNLSQELVDNTKYYVSQTSAGCESGKTEILINLSDPKAPTGDATQNFCSASSPTLKDVLVTGTSIKWYNNIGNPILETSALQNGETYYATQTVNGCESTQKLAVKVNVVTNYLSAKDFTDSFCNDTTDNFKIINIDNYRKELISNPQDYSFEIRNSRGELESGDTKLNIGANIFDVKIMSSLGCFQFVKLNLTLNEKPKLDLPADAEFCDNVGTPLKVDFVGGYKYQWNTGETSNSIIANKEQIYTVTVTTLAGCVNTASTVVKKAKLAEIQNILITNNSAMVIMTFAGDYLYSLDHINWKADNRFENLKNGNYTVYVKTKLGCDLGSNSFTIFSLSNVFSPNDDGINDTWKISGIENYPNSEIKIFDVQGKMVVNHITKGEAFEWNGKYNGKKLPTDSYWYQIKLSDGRILEGYVVIKNRD
ncbi:T9SS type B sorting domain-containing protein [Epilithonimonas sp.]|uniref:DUF7948 domain-containing protein n=1 Tax=Epilithonimonas sp. TaxID=2894511 RepID=UPI0035B08607